MSSFWHEADWSAGRCGEQVGEEDGEVELKPTSEKQAQPRPVTGWKRPGQQLLRPRHALPPARFPSNETTDAFICHSMLFQTVGQDQWVATLKEYRTE